MAIPAQPEIPLKPTRADAVRRLRELFFSWPMLMFIGLAFGADYLKWGVVYFLLWMCQFLPGGLVPRVASVLCAVGFVLGCVMFLRQIKPVKAARMQGEWRRISTWPWLMMMASVVFFTPSVASLMIWDDMGEGSVLIKLKSGKFARATAQAELRSHLGAMRKHGIWHPFD